EEWTSITSVSTSIFLKMAENNFVRQKRPGRIVNLLSKTSSGDRSGLELHSGSRKLLIPMQWMQDSRNVIGMARRGQLPH
ncbi:MAG: hypothetical protein P1U90_18760, partial [Akkermansiaceae bacterium]|nr:hypothetical protein [Akkermansiaceae bacterium]